MFELDLEGYEMSGKARIFNFYLIYLNFKILKIKFKIYLRNFRSYFLI